MIPDDKTCRLIYRMYHLQGLSLMRCGSVFDLRVRDVRLALAYCDDGLPPRRMRDRSTPSLQHVSLVDGVPFP